MNLICICLDTFRADIVGPGKKLSHGDTPNLDGFAEESIRMPQAFREGQPTPQTRRSLFTGPNNNFQPDRPTLIFCKGVFN